MVKFLELSEKDFTRFADFIKLNYGINLTQKKSLIENRLKNTLISKGYDSFSKYIDNIIKENNSNDIELMLNKLTTNYTYFMREEQHFKFFKNVILPYLLEKNKSRKMFSIWSAGCSSGDEPYTISMILKDFMGSKAKEWDTRVLATDVSNNALNLAKQGVYDEQALKGVPSDWKKKYFKETSEKDKYQVSDEIKNNVIFKNFNLMNPIKFKIKFDVIFCRNVMIYFEKDTKTDLVRRFYDATHPGGYLLIGHSESLDKSQYRYNYIQPATFRKPDF